VKLKPVILLRIAAVLMFIHLAGHTMGMLQGPSHGAAESAVIDAMKSRHFDVMGSSRSYWDFFLGFGYDASLNMLMQTVLLWLLANMAKTDPVRTRPFTALLTLTWIGSVALDVRYFFAAPLVFAIVLTVVLALAWIGAGRAPVLSSPRA
jgi:hypothetical protein